MRGRWLWLIILASLGVFAYVLFTLPWHDVLLTLTAAKLSYVLIYLGTSVLIKFLLAARWQLILRAKKIELPYLSTLAYRFAAGAVSFVTPGPRVGGEAVAAGLLARRDKKVKFSKALSTILLDRSVELQTFAFMFFSGVLILSLLHDIPDTLQIFLLVSSTLLVLVMLLFAVNVRYGKPFFSQLAARFSSSKKFQRELKHFEDTVTSFYREDRRDFVLSHLVSAVAWSVSIVEYDYLLRILGLDLPLYAIFIVYSFVGLAYLIPVPLAIGSLEGSQIAAFALIGLQTSAGVLLALITRLRDILFTIIGFMVLVYHGITPRTAQEAIRQ